MLALVAVLGFAAPVVAQESAPAPSAFDLAVSVPRGGAAKSSKPSVESLLGVMGRTTRFKQVAVSPDGEWLAWVEVAATGGTLIQAMELGAREPKALLVSACPEGKTCDESSIQWSPEGRRLLFLSDGHQRGRTQVYVADLQEGVATKLTSFESPIASPRWSPDGASVAVLVMQGEGAAQALGPRGPGARETGVVRESHPVQRVAVVSVAEGSHRFVTPEQTFVYEFAWSPDAARLAYTGAPPPGDASWWLAKLHVVETASARSRVLYAPKWQLTEPTWSPDGKQVAVIEGLMSDHGSNGGDVMLVPLDGGKARNLTAGMKATAMSLEWVSSRSLVFGAQVRGESAVATVDPTQQGEPRVLWKGAERISARGQVGLSLSRDGKVSAVVRESFSRAQNLWVGPVGEWERVTRREEDLRALVGEARDLTWKSDGVEVQGWLVAPPPSMMPPPGVRAPMVTMVHGGPAAGVVPGFRPDVLMFTARGYYVFLPNYRGSFGQGAEFAQANRRDFGFGDLRDILSGVDAVLARAPVDPARLGVTGWSYGGFMAMWAVTQTQRFRAAVAGAGISNWQSYYGTNRIDAWMKPYFGASLYDEPEIYTRSSPINSMKLARTPTLVLHGERDLEVPVTQGHEFHRALKELGVKTQLVVYADEGHTLRKPEHVVDRMRRTVEWMDAHLPSGSAGGAARTSLLPR